MSRRMPSNAVHHDGKWYLQDLRGNLTPYDPSAPVADPLAALREIRRERINAASARSAVGDSEAEHRTEVEKEAEMVTRKIDHEEAEKEGVEREELVSPVLSEIDFPSGRDSAASPAVERAQVREEVVKTSPVRATPARSQSATRTPYRTPVSDVVRSTTKHPEELAKSSHRGATTASAFSGKLADSPYAKDPRPASAGRARPSTAKTSESRSSSRPSSRPQPRVVKEVGFDPDKILTRETPAFYTGGKLASDQHGDVKGLKGGGGKGGGRAPWR